MKHKIILLGILAAVILPALAAALLSCASAPEETVFEAPDEEKALAEALRDRIEEFGLAELAQSDYDAAEARYKEGTMAYGQDNEASRKAFDGAIAYYQAVIDKAFPILVGNVKTDADSYRRQADAIKASVAVKEDYAAAKTVYDSAMAEEQAGNYEKAAELFGQAEELFAQVYADAKEKKDKAEQALKEALENLESSEEKAREADREMGQ